MVVMMKIMIIKKLVYLMEKYVIRGERRKGRGNSVSHGEVHVHVCDVKKERRDGEEERRVTEKKR